MAFERTQIPRHNENCESVIGVPFVGSNTHPSGGGGDGRRDETQPRPVREFNPPPRARSTTDGGTQIPLTCPGGFIYSADCVCRHCTGRCRCEPRRFRVVDVTQSGTSRVTDYFGAQNTGSKPEMRLKDAFLPPADDPQF